MDLMQVTKVFIFSFPQKFPQSSTLSVHCSKKNIFYVSINIWNIICCTIFKILNPLWEFEWSAELDVDFPTGTIRTNVLERDETRATSREAKMRVIGLVPRRHNSPLEAVAADLGFFLQHKNTIWNWKHCNMSSKNLQT